MANPDVGTITCAFTGEKDCPVRRYSKGKKYLYYVSSMGMITPNKEAGQEYMRKHTQFFGDNGEPLQPVTKNTPVKAENPVNGKNAVNDEQKPGGLLGWFFDDD